MDPVVLSAAQNDTLNLQNAVFGMWLSIHHLSVYN